MCQKLRWAFSTWDLIWNSQHLITMVTSGPILQMRNCDRKKLHHFLGPRKPRLRLQWRFPSASSRPPAWESQVRQRAAGSWHFQWRAKQRFGGDEPCRIPRRTQYQPGNWEQESQLPLPVSNYFPKRAAPAVPGRLSEGRPRASLQIQTLLVSLDFRGGKEQNTKWKEEMVGLRK